MSTPDLQINSFPLSSSQVFSQWPPAIHQSHPFHDAAFGHALSKTENHICVQVSNCTQIWFSAYQVNQGVAVCCFPGRPFMTSNSLMKTYDELKAIIAGISRTLGLPVYLPLVTNSEQAWQNLIDSANFLSWLRLPSPTIGAKNISSDFICKRASKRLGSWIERKLRKCERNGLVTVTASKTTAFDIIRQIEMASWKRTTKQDMWSRGQSHIYEELIKLPNVVVRVLFDKSEPVAYRIDSRVSDVLYVLKWSFSEEYKSYSPGTYLLVRDLPHCYENSNLDFIDLYGSPDTLKRSICDIGSDIIRRDFAYPADNHLLLNIRDERLAYDAQLSRAFESGKSIKTIYV